MYIPDIKVVPMELETNVSIIANFLDPQKGKANTSRPFAQKTYQLYPELIGCIEDTMTYEDILPIVRPVVSKRLQDANSEINARIQYFSDKFHTYHKQFMEELLTLAEYTNWEDGKDIVCYVGYIPFYPRNLNDKSFCVSYADEERVFLGMPHEIDHFVFFEKWKELYGHEEGKDVHHPSPLWFLLEMIVDPTLNLPKIEELTGYTHKAYVQFYTEKIGDRIVMDYLKEFFDKRTDIKDFLDKTYEFCEKNRKELTEKCG